MQTPASLHCARRRHRRARENLLQLGQRLQMPFSGSGKKGRSDGREKEWLSIILFGRVLYGRAMLTSYRKTKVYCKRSPFLNWTNDFRKTLDHLYRCAQSNSKMTKLGQETWPRGINIVIACSSRVPSSVSKTYPSSITLSSSPSTAPVSMYQLQHLLVLPGPILSCHLPSFPNSPSTMT